MAFKSRLKYFCAQSGRHFLHSCKFRFKCLYERMIRQISYSLLILFLFASCENRYRKVGSPSHSPSSVDSKFVGITSDDAYQVSADEYDENFVSRYGLLYLKASNNPFTGRILIVDLGESGEFISSDESWKDGRKHGKSTKWFSNGIKMYERNYREGRWHGSVTRWWPNGQKMYVRAYTNGVRHGSEATWRSDGTPLSLPADGTPSPIQASESTESIESLPDIDLTDSPTVPDTNTVADEFEFDAPVPLDEPAPLDLPDPILEPTPEDSADGFSDLPSFPPMEEESEVVSGEELPSLPNADDSESAFPAADPPSLPVDSPALPVFPDEATNELPALPGVDESETPPANEPLPPLPGLPNEADSNGLPSLPGMEENGGLPPLPDSGGDDFGDLPPLPPLP